MKPAGEWDEQHILHGLPIGEFDWLEFKSRRGLDLTVPNVKESDVRDNLSRALSAFANTGGGTLVYGISDPKPADGRLLVDDSGIATTLGKKGDTREWLESIIPDLVDPPLRGFNVYSVLPDGPASEIEAGRALYVVDVPASQDAPHQANDHRYYARVAGRSRPIGHRLVADIMGRRSAPKLHVLLRVEQGEHEARRTEAGFTEHLRTLSLLFTVENRSVAMATYARFVVWLDARLELQTHPVFDATMEVGASLDGKWHKVCGVGRDWAIPEQLPIWQGHPRHLGTIVVSYPRFTPAAYPVIWETRAPHSAGIVGGFLVKPTVFDTVEVSTLASVVPSDWGFDCL